MEEDAFPFASGKQMRRTLTSGSLHSHYDQTEWWLYTNSLRSFICRYMPPHSYNAYANYFAAAAAMGAQPSHLPHGAHQGVPMHMPSPPMAPMMLAGYAPVQVSRGRVGRDGFLLGFSLQQVSQAALHADQLCRRAEDAVPFSFMRR